MHEKRTATVLGTTMAYVETGEGDPIVFLHGNPTSSFLWRNIIPHVAGQGRVIAPDLIGMGDSAKLPGTGDDRYRFVAHRRHLDALLDELGVVANVVLVGHDWGSALAFDWARRHAGAVAGIAYMEAIVRPFTWAGLGPVAKYFRGWRSPAGEGIVLDRNEFVERFFPTAMLRSLSDADMAEYLRPYRNPGEDRRPTLTWPREVPIAGEPADVHAIVSDYAAFLRETTIPKLFVNADPGLALTGEDREFARTFKAQTEVTVTGTHFVQEDAPDQIGAALSQWLSTLDRAAPDRRAA